MLERPSTIHSEMGGVSPLGPWSFLAAGLRGGFSAWGVQLLCAWAAFQSLPALVWAARLSSGVGDSALADGWGASLSAVDLLDLLQGGGPGVSDLGFPAGAVALGTLLWALWASWKMQAGAAGLRAGFASWAIGLPTALLIGWPPLWALHASLWGSLSFLAGLGIQPMGWADFVLGPLLRMAFVSSLMLQWWLCRLELARIMPKDAGGWLRFLKLGAVRLWSHPVQWGSVVFGGVALRVGLAFCAIMPAWGWGGESLPRVWLFLAMQVGAAAANAWLMGWALRVAALYWKNDDGLRAAIRLLTKTR